MHRTLLSTAALVAAFVLLFSSAHAQIRQTHLYIDDGSGHFTILTAASGGGLLTFPASGTLLSSSGGSLTALNTLTLGTSNSPGPAVAGTLTLYNSAGTATANLTYDGTNFVMASGGLNLSSGMSRTTGLQSGGSTAFWVDGSTNSNTFGGLLAGSSMSSGQYSTAFGYGALQHSNASFNDAFGDGALGQLTAGSGNVSIGFASSNSVTNQAGNVAVGFQAMRQGNSFYNVALGYNAMYGATGYTGAECTAVGASALYYSSGTISGSGITAIGYAATAGDFSITDATALGANASVGLSHEIQLGATTVTLVNTSGAITSGDGSHAGAINITDGAGGHTATIQAGAGTATLTLPTSSGTLATTSGVIVTAPGSTQTIISQATNIHPLVIQGASGQTFDLQDWNNSTPSTLLGVTAGGALNQTTASGGSSPTTGIQFNSHTYFWGNDNPGVFVGRGSGASMPTSSLQNDVALGFNTLNHENTGSGDNTAVGYDALQTETGATGDVAIGYTAMSALSSGDYNVAVGFNSMANNSHGGTGNVAVGFNTISLGTVAANNSTVAVGYQALENVDGTSDNTGVGYNALHTNAAGNDNTAVGYQAAVNNTADNNTAIGSNAMEYSTSSTNDVAVGYHAMLGVSGSPNTGNDNTAIGTNSLAGEKTTGADNTGLGYNSLHTIQSGTKNTAVGSGADVSSGFATERTAIGYGASSASDHNIQLGSTTVTSVTTSGVITTGDATGDVGGLKITDGTNTAEITATTATNNPVFNLPAESGAGPYTLVTSGTDVVLAPGADQTVQPTADIVPLILKGESGQTHDLQEWQTSGGTKLAEVTAGGALDFANGMTATTGIQIGNVGTTVFWSTTDAVFAGSGAGGTYTGSGFNTGFGFDALNALSNSSTGTDNDAFGREALLSNTSGSSNSAFGDDALKDNVSGSNNTAIGGTALLTLGNSGGSGSNNTAVGYEALESASSVSSNTAVGYFALQASSGFGNVGIGYQAGYGSGGGGPNKVTTGANNTYLGYNASPGSSTQHNNSTAIGTYATVDEDDALVLGEISGTNGASTTVKVGIGTNQPAALLSVGTSSALQVDASGNVQTSGHITTTSSIGSATNDGSVVSNQSATGSDVAGYVTFDAASGSSGFAAYVDVAYGTSYSGTPHVIVVPANPAAAISGAGITSYYVDDSSVSGHFRIYVNTGGSGVTGAKFNYHIIANS